MANGTSRVALGFLFLKKEKWRRNKVVTPETQKPGIVWVGRDLVPSPGMGRATFNMTVKRSIAFRKWHFWQIPEWWNLK